MNYLNYPKELVQLKKLICQQQEERRKIPKNVLEEINRYKSNKYVYHYDYSKTLLEQEMLPLTKELLYYIYTKYLFKT